MIVTSVVVLAIVGSAFAFHAKVGRFCVLTTTDPGDNCTTLLDLPRKTTTGAGLAYKFYPCFEGDKTACSTANNHNCTATTTITTD